MRKQLLAALFFAAMFSAKAQNENLYIGIKCPICKEEKKIKVWDYSKNKNEESFTNANDFIIINWRDLTVETWATGVQKIDQYVVFASRSIVKIWFGTKVLTIYYNDQKGYAGHEITAL